MSDFLIQPILLGADINCYSVARAYHEEYGVKSIAFGKCSIGATKNSKIIDFRVRPEIKDESKLLQILIDLSKEYLTSNKKLILMGCTDEYSEFIIDNKEILSKYFITPYIDKGLKNKLISKDSFYQMCEEHGLAYPKTFVLSKNDEVIDFGIKYPLILKAADSISYFQHPFEGMKKAYIVESFDELKTIVNKIYSNGYEKNLITQDFIPGDDSHMRVLTCYSDKNGKVKMMCLGHVLLEEHTPKGIGNHAAIITYHDKDLMEKFKSFLESINYTGYSNFDIKNDSRENKYKVFEINLRQGRSNFYVTSSGNNIAKYIVEDMVLNKNIDLKIQKENFFWSVIPKRIVYKYVKNKDLVLKAKHLVKEGKSANSFEYKDDLRGNLKRSIYIKLYNINQVRKFNKYCK